MAGASGGRGRPAVARAAAARACAAERQPGGRRGVDRLAHDRVAEAKAARDVRRDARGRRRAGGRATAARRRGIEVGGIGRQLRVEALADGRRSLQQLPRGCVEAIELALERRR